MPTFTNLPALNCILCIGKSKRKTETVVDYTYGLTNQVFIIIIYYNVIKYLQTFIKPLKYTAGYPAFGS